MFCLSFLSYLFTSFKPLIRSDEELMLKRGHSNFFTVVILPYEIYR